MTEQEVNSEFQILSKHDQYKTPDPKLKNRSYISTEDESLNNSFLSKKKERYHDLKEEDEDINSRISPKRIIYSDQKIQKFSESCLKLNDLQINSVGVRNYLIPSSLKTYHLRDLNFNETLINCLRKSNFEIAGKKFKKIKITKIRELKETNSIICDDLIFSEIEGSLTE